MTTSTNPSGSQNEARGFTDPPKAGMFGSHTALIEIVVVALIGGLAVGAMIVGITSSDPRGVTVALFGVTALISLLLVLIGIARDARARDSGLRAEVRLERLIALQMEQLGVLHAMHERVTKAPESEPHD